MVEITEVHCSTVHHAGESHKKMNKLCHVLLPAFAPFYGGPMVLRIPGVAAASGPRRSMLVYSNSISGSSSSIISGSSSRRGGLTVKAEHKSSLRPLERPTIVTEEPVTEHRKAVTDKTELDMTKHMFIPPSAVGMDLKSLKRLPGSNIFVPPVSFDFRVKQAVFVKGSIKVSQCPNDGLPEFAMVGRSNVGKSSLINALVQKKEFAETSKKPGKTQVINHYLINKSWYLVDLPGYGFANVPTDVRSAWNAFTKNFFLRSESLVSVILLIDASIPPQSIDLDCADWLGRNKIPLTIVFTKCDKSKKKIEGRKLEENVGEFLRLLKKSYEQMPAWVMTSCVTNQGRDELLTHIMQLRDYWSG